MKGGMFRSTMRTQPTKTVILQSRVYKNNKKHIYFKKYLHISKKCNTFAPCFKKNKHNCEFYILTIMYCSQINNLKLNNKNYAIMKAIIIKNDGSNLKIESNYLGLFIKELEKHLYNMSKQEDNISQINIVEE